jgi:hypothetical protein
MKLSRLFVGLLLVAVLVMLVPASHAQTGPNCQAAGSTINCNVIAVGSSGIYSSAALASISPDPTRGNAALCGTHFWTGTGFGRDPRKTLVTPNLGDESATIWIAWDNDTTPTIICAYLATDSLVGQRLFFSQGSGASGPTNNGQLILTSGATGACGTAGANKVSFIWDTATTGLPSAVYNALEGTTGTTCPTPGTPVNFTTASTDVDPTDALFVGNQRVLGTNSTSSAAFPADAKTNLGYGGSTQCNGPAIISAYSSGAANGVCYTYVAGQPDPISGTVIPASQIVSEGALVQIPLVNITNTTSGGFGDLYTNRGFNNVLSRNLAAGYAFSPYGTATLTRDLYLGPNPGSIPVVGAHYLVREPQSGTYTTFEWQVVRNKETALGGGGLSQETNVCGASQLAFGCAYTTPAANPAQCPAQTSNLTNLTFPATSACSNYAAWGAGGAFNALKTRVIGNGEMVNVLNVNASAGGPSGSACTATVFPAAPCITDTFGYGFWSLGTEGGKGNVRYLQLDGTDGLYSGWTAAAGGNNGAFPVTIGGASGQGKSATPGPAPADGCAGYFNGNGTTIQTFACNTWNYPTFANVVTGSYRLWNFNRVMWFAPAGGGALNPNWTALNAPAFWLSAADQAAPVVGSPAHGTLPDFMPFGYCANAGACPSGSAPTLTYPMTAIRAHYSVPTWGIGNANNGITGSGFGGVENGGDVAGATVGVQAEADSVGFFSSSFLSWVQ